MLQDLLVISFYALNKRLLQGLLQRLLQQNGFKTQHLKKQLTIYILFEFKLFLCLKILRCVYFVRIRRQYYTNVLKSHLQSKSKIKKRVKVKQHSFFFHKQTTSELKK